MRIVAVTACTIGVAHTYIAKDRLVEAAKERGDTISVETQGTIGSESVLTPEEIAKADVVILAADVAVADADRFKGKPIVHVGSSVAIKQHKKLLDKVEQKLKERK